jgi:transcriptional regulator with XRE-family HTH domain
MGTVLENINKIASTEKSSWLDDAKVRQSKKDWTNRSFKIAVRILREIRAQKATKGMTQKKLAQIMGVSPQYINKVVKGKENLTLETISKIEEVLGVQLIEVMLPETSQSIIVEDIVSITAVSRVSSIPISENVYSYNNNIYSDATGTYG